MLPVLLAALSIGAGSARGQWVNISPSVRRPNFYAFGTGFCAYASAETAARAAGYPSAQGLVRWRYQTQPRYVCHGHGCSWMYSGGGRPDLSDVQAALRKRGIPATACRGPRCWQRVERSLRQGRPCMACFRAGPTVGHCVVPSGWRGGRFYYYDPDRPRTLQSMSRQDWFARYRTGGQAVLTFDR
jgi:hypothetical protein